MRYKSRLVAVTAFAFVFLFELFLNLDIPCMRSLPDEMGAVALAAQISGYDWSYVMTHPSQYYGFGTTLLFLPFFLTVKNPRLLYQCLLGVAAFLHAVPAYLSIRIVQKYYKNVQNMFFLFALGIISALCTPTRATNIDNEPMLIVCCWLIVYLLISLQNNDKKQKLYSVELALVLGFSYLSHVRALIYSIAVFFVVLVYYIFNKKLLIHLWAFISPYIVGMFFCFFFSKQAQTRLYTTDTTTVINNTVNAVSGSFVKKLSLLISEFGIRSFLDLLCSNLWVIFVFGCGIIIVCLSNTILSIFTYARTRIKGNLMQNDTLFFPELFCTIGILTSLAGLCIIWLPNAIAVYSDGENLSRGHFYLRYYGNYFGPCAMFFLLYFYSKKKSDLFEKIVKGVSVFVLVLSAFYSIVSCVSKVLQNYDLQVDWFYYFGTFSGTSGVWPSNIQSLSYFLCATLFAFLIFMLLNGKRRYFAVSLLACYLLCQYVYGVKNFDIPFTSSKNYYGSVNASYELSKINNEIFAEADSFFYYNETNGPQYIVQFMFPEYGLVTDLDLLDNAKDNIILSNTLLDHEYLDENYSYVILDSNEYLYINNSERKIMLIQEGFILQNIS